MAFGRLFDRGARRRRAAVESVYAALLAEARDPCLYREGAVPDTFDGRFEMMIWHLAPITLRLRDGGAAARAFSQDLFDHFLKDMDRSMREAGVGDIAVPKRLKKMVRVWFGRVRAMEALEGVDDRAEAMRPVLERNLFPESEAPDLAPLAHRLAERWRMVATTPVEEIVAGHAPFARAEAAA